MGIEFQIGVGGNLPIYRQLIDQVRYGIASGSLEIGEKLPSVRSLSEQLVVNHNTVAKAYNELVREGVLESRHGKGVFVGPQRERYTKAEKNRRLSASLDAFLSEARSLGLDDKQITTAVSERLSQLKKEFAEQQTGQNKT